MTETKEALCDRMIRIYGFENPLVVSFCSLCEENHLNEKTLEELVKAHEKFPMVFQKEDE